MNKEDVKELARELVELTLESKKLNSRIKLLKGQILEYTDLENTDSIDFEGPHGYWVVVDTKINYKLVDIPKNNYELKVDEAIMSEDMFVENVAVRFGLSRNGNKLLKTGDAEIRKYLIPNTKKTISVTNNKKN